MSKSSIVSDRCQEIKRSIRRKINDIREGIENLIKWFPIIWKDREFDYYYIYVILRKKLILTRDFFNSEYAVSMDSKKEAKNIDLCIKLLNRLIDDNYELNSFKYHDKKWGEIKFSWKDYKNDLCRLNITRELIKTELDDIQERKESRRCFKHAEDIKKQDIDFLFKIMKKHILKWWD